MTQPPSHLDEPSEVKPKLIALFGGTFDPIHNGHLQTVTALKNDLSIDEVRWVVSAKPPHRDKPSASPEQRIQMLSLALQSSAGMVCDDIELKREGPSYTVLTLQTYRQQFPDAHLVLIVGADVMQSFHTWHQYEDISKLAHIVVMHRSGYDSTLSKVLAPLETKQLADLKNVKNGKVLMYAAPAVPISATTIRERLFNGQEVSGLVSKPVEDYIDLHKLYSPQSNI